MYAELNWHLLGRYLTSNGADVVEGSLVTSTGGNGQLVIVVSSRTTPAVLVGVKVLLVTTPVFAIVCLNTRDLQKKNVSQLRYDRAISYIGKTIINSKTYSYSQHYSAVVQ